MSDSLSYDWVPTGRTGLGSLTVRLGDVVLHIDSINVTKADARRRFTTALCERHRGIPEEEVEEALLQLAARITSTSGEVGQGPSLSTPLELDVRRIVRPERAVTSELSAITVPMAVEVDGEPVGQWVTYIQWADGTRERAEIRRTIRLPSDEYLYVYPQPAAPPPTTPPSWSRASRTAFMEGIAPRAPARLFLQLAEQFDHFLDFPADNVRGAIATLVLWTVLSYQYLAWDAVPYLYLGGPLASGKSRVFEVLSRLVFRPLSSSNMTSAAMFRTLHDRGGILLLDEAERLRETGPEVVELRSLLLAGYRRGGRATRLESAGDTFITREFDVYGPKALAAISGLPPAVASRCIPLVMFRAAPTSVKPRRRIDADPARWQTLRDDLHILALSQGATWLELAQRTEVCPEMSGRQFELWQPLMALAWWFESCGVRHLLRIVQEYAADSNAVAQDDQTPDHDLILLQVLTSFIRAGDMPTPAEILQDAKEKEAELFGRWTSTGVAMALRRYGFHTRKSGDRRYRSVTLADISRVQRHYGIDLGIEDATGAPG